MITRTSKLDAHAEALTSWGGATIHFVTGEWVPQGIDAYAVTVKPSGVETIAIPEDADLTKFIAAFDEAIERFSFATYLGIFHDDDLGEIHFDPTEVVYSTAEVDELAKTHPVVGGAYHFATGDGYWPKPLAA